MRFKDFVWPVNPSEISFSEANNIKEMQLLYGGCILQNLGKRPKKITGRGSFTGENAYSDFEKLQKLSEEETSGVLLISGMAPCIAMFSSLKMLSSSLKNTVGYEFTFIEDIGEGDFSQSDEKYVTLGAGENLWHLSANYSVPIEKLMLLNPLIPSPFEVYEGERVRIQ